MTTDAGRASLVVKLVSLFFELFLYRDDDADNANHSPNAKPKPKLNNSNKPNDNDNTEANAKYKPNENTNPNLHLVPQNSNTKKSPNDAVRRVVWASGMFSLLYICVFLIGYIYINNSNLPDHSINRYLTTQI
jgi:hypothetical protein